MTRRQLHPCGTARDRPDRRDQPYPIPPHLRRRRPAAVDLRGSMPPVYDQGHLNACSANAIAAALWFDERRHSPRGSSPSRLFIYYHERVIEGVVDRDAPVSLRDGYQTVARVGVCSERQWPYNPRRFQRRPTASCFARAQHHRAIRYSRLDQSLIHMQACLAEGYPFTVGLAVHQTFKAALVTRTGVVSLPDLGRDPLLGGHAVLVVGYQEDSRHFIVRNSWGPAWGDRGYCYVPYRYMLDPQLSWDLWTVRRMT